MHIIRVYRPKMGGLIATFTGIDAERMLQESGLDNGVNLVLR